VKILVTGGSGFLGSHLLPRLTEAGHSVRSLSRGEPPALSPPGVEWIRGDLNDPAAVKASLQDVEAVYHLAGRVSFDPQEAPLMFALHVTATRTLLEACRAAGVARFILASTSGTTAVSPVERIGTEADEAPIALVGRWPYYLSKLYEERLTRDLCREWELPLVILNPGLLLGPGDERRSSTWVVQRLLDRVVPTRSNGGLALVDVRDAADAFAQALTRGELYGKHLLGTNLSFHELFERTERLSGVPMPRLRLPRSATIAGGKLLAGWALFRGTRPLLEAAAVEVAEHFLYLDSSKAERLLGFKARDPQETLLDTVKYLERKLSPHVST